MKTAGRGVDYFVVMRGDSSMLGDVQRYVQPGGKIIQVAKKCFSLGRNHLLIDNRNLNNQQPEYLKYKSLGFKEESEEPNLVFDVLTL